MRQKRAMTELSTNHGLWMNWEKICPNLSFTVENKVDNLYAK